MEPNTKNYDSSLKHNYKICRGPKIQLKQVCLTQPGVGNISALISSQWDKWPGSYWKKFWFFIKHSYKIWQTFFKESFKSIYFQTSPVIHSDRNWSYLLIHVYISLFILGFGSFSPPYRRCCSLSEQPVPPTKKTPQFLTAEIVYSYEDVSHLSSTHSPGMSVTNRCFSLSCCLSVLITRLVLLEEAHKTNNNNKKLHSCKNKERQKHHYRSRWSETFTSSCKVFNVF